MSDVVSTQFGLMVPHDKLGPCIEFLEDGLRSLKPTPYHQVLGKHFLRQADDLAGWLSEFHKQAVAAKLNLTALYVEMNGFTINPDQWHCDLFGYNKAGDIWELDWLSNSESIGPGRVPREPHLMRRSFFSPPMNDDGRPFCFIVVHSRTSAVILSASHEHVTANAA